MEGFVGGLPAGGVCHYNLEKEHVGEKSCVKQEKQHLEKQ